MDNNKEKLLLELSIAYWLLALIIFGVAHTQFDHVTVENDTRSTLMLAVIRDILIVSIPEDTPWFEHLLEAYI